jgi:hypothetical protein
LNLNFTVQSSSFDDEVAAGAGLGSVGLVGVPMVVPVIGGDVGTMGIGGAGTDGNVSGVGTCWVTAEDNSAKLEAPGMVGAVDEIVAAGGATLPVAMVIAGAGSGPFV